jgi:hypothetical protein
MLRLDPDLGEVLILIEYGQLAAAGTSLFVGSGFPVGGMRLRTFAAESEIQRFRPSASLRPE